MLVNWGIVGEVLVGRGSAADADTEEGLRGRTARKTAEESVPSRRFNRVQLAVGEAVLLPNVSLGVDRSARQGRVR